MGGSGSSSGKGGGGGAGIKNTTGASERAVNLLREAIPEVARYSASQVTIAESYRGGKVADRTFEKELTALAYENGYNIEFRTERRRSSMRTERMNVLGDYIRDNVNYARRYGVLTKGLPPSLRNK